MPSSSSTLVAQGKDFPTLTPIGPPEQLGRVSADCLNVSQMCPTKVLQQSYPGQFVRILDRMCALYPADDGFEVRDGAERLSVAPTAFLAIARAAQAMRDAG